MIIQEHEPGLEPKSHIPKGLGGSAIGSQEGFMKDLILLGRVKGSMFVQKGEDHISPIILDCVNNALCEEEGAELMVAALYHEL